MRRLDLDEPRTGVELVTTALRLWLRHLPVFFVLAALVADPSGAGELSVDVVAQSLAVSFTALAGTLLFFDMRASSDPIS